MKQLYHLLGGLLLTGMTLHAQTANIAASAPPTPPCSTFENVAASSNWFAQPSIGVQFVNTNPLDGSICVTLFDGPSGTWYRNNTDYNNLGQRFPGQCLCFDYFLINDGDAGSPPFYPTIYLSDGTNTIAFVSSTAVTEGSGWISVCAPIEHCNGGTLPGNANGNWIMAAGMTCADFNNVLDNVTSVSFPTDITGSPSEVMSIDNVCVKQCGKNCEFEFGLYTDFLTDGTAYADINLTMIMNATYTVDWGDGTPPTLPTATHFYTAPGTYNVCVTMVIRTKDGAIVSTCTKCLTFCYGEYYIDPKGGDLPSKRKETPKITLSMKDMPFDNESYLIYPNPSQDQATVEIALLEKDHVSVRIMDGLGKVVSETSGNFDAGGQKIKLNTEKLSTGVYNVEITVGDKTSIQKLSIAK